MTESLTDRIELLSSINLTERYELANKVRALETENAELRKEVQKQETLKDWARVDADEAEKEIDALKTSLAEYKYTPQAYDELWERVKEAGE